MENKPIFKRVFDKNNTGDYIDIAVCKGERNGSVIYYGKTIDNVISFTDWTYNEDITIETLEVHVQSYFNWRAVNRAVDKYYKDWLEKIEDKKDV